ncbi:unnamed protein product [Victoria cruziana]
MAMANRNLSARMAFRLFSSTGSGKMLSEEEKAAENVYIKKVEQEKLEKIARKGYKPEEHSTEVKTTATNAKSSSSSPPSSSGISTDRYRNYAILSGVIAMAASVGWYLKSTAKRPEEVQD